MNIGVVAALVPNRNLIPRSLIRWVDTGNRPATSNILIDDTHALMTRRTFEDLPEYSATNPTGAYEGKMWRRHDGAFDREFLARGGKPVWLLCWYGESELPDFVSNNSREILLADDDVSMLR